MQKKGESGKIGIYAEALGMNRENLPVKKVIIVGGGMAGLTCATNLSRRFNGNKITVIEKLPRIGKKILSTGNGQCNLTNENISLSNFHGSSVDFSRYAIDTFGSKSLISFFEELGVKMVCDNGKYYPQSKQASSVLDALRFYLAYKNVNIVTEETVVDISKKEYFTVTTDKGNKYYAEKVIVAVGGKSAKHLGTDGTSYKLLEKFGHKTTKLYPSLVQLKCNPQEVKGLKGLKAQVSLYAKCENIVSPTIKGELLFTDYGISGNAVFSVSSHVAGCKNAVVYVDFCPNMDSEELELFISNKINNCPYLTYENLLAGILPNKIALRLVINCGFKPDEKVSLSCLSKITKAVKNTSFVITGDTGFDNSQVTHGGVLTCDFNDKTMESKLVSGLYAVGEVLDIDGDCGGYNLQWAFSSAMTASKDIK